MKSAYSLRAHGLQLLVAVFLSVLPMHGEIERDVLRQTRGIVIDGELSDWVGHPYNVWWEAKASDARFSAVSYQGWQSEGIVVGIRAYSSTEVAKNAGDSSIDIFIDTRPRSARMDKYEDGVFHLLIKRSSESGTAPEFVQVDDKGLPVVNRELSACRADFRGLPNGWTGEYLIPWKCIKLSAPPKIGSWFAFSVRINQRLSEKNVASLGASSVDAKNALEDTPVAFSPVRILQASATPEPISFRAEEVVIQGEPWLEIECIAPSDLVGETTLQLRYETKRSQSAFSIPFVDSPGGRFRVAREYYPPSAEDKNGGALPVTLEISSLHWKRLVSIPTPVRSKFHEIDQALPEASIGTLPEAEQSMAHLLKEAAKESATLLSSSLDGKKAPQRLFRPVFSPGIYDAKIDLFVRLAKEFIGGRKLTTDFPYRAWRSEIDGAWLPIKIVYPWNYDPTRVYPARVDIYGLSRWRTRAQFMENDLQVLSGGGYYPFAGNYFTIALYGRGNSYLSLGEEELNYIFNRLIPSLPVDARRVSIYGGSHGGFAAIELALRYPDRFAWVYSRAGTFSPILPTANDPEQPLRLLNLSTSSVYLTAGEEDKNVAESNRLLKSALEIVGVPCVYQEWPSTGHYFSPEDPPLAVSSHIVPERPRHVSICTGTLETAQAFWLAGLSISKWGAPLSIVGDADGHELHISTKNTTLFSVDFSKTPQDIFPTGITIDGQILANLERPPSPARVTFRLAGKSWSILPASEELPIGGKRAGLSGPAGEIEKRRFLIVYGTLKSQLKPYLRARAIRILRERVGTDEDQWGGGHFQIREDKTVTSAEIASCNLWLIGNAAENSVVAMLRGSLPLATDAGGVSIGFRRVESENILLSYIFPNPQRTHHLYIEQGTSPFAYSAVILGNPDKDISVQQVSRDGAKVLFTTNFSSDWKVNR